MCFILKHAGEEVLLHKLLKTIMISFLTGQQVYFRGIESSDFVFLKKWISDEKVTALLETGTFPPTTERLNEQFGRDLTSAKDVVFIIIRTADDVPIGWGGLYDINWIAHSCELRFFIGETKSWTLSFALEGMLLLIKYGFEKLNMHRIKAGANVENGRSWKTLERVGFVREGIFRDLIYRNGRYYDAYMYSILKKEYEKLIERQKIPT